MKALILAAGYGTRMYPLTKDRPKGLLPVAGRPVMDYILERVEAVADVDTVYIVTNQRFYAAFVDWLRDLRPRCSKEIELINDGTASNETRLGSIRDMQLVITERGIREDLMVLGGDNIFEMDMSASGGFVDYFRRMPGDVVAVHKVEDVERLKKTGVALLDKDLRLLEFQEKPEKPLSHWAVPPLYIFRRQTLPLIREYLEQGNNPDAPGNFIAWLHKRRPVYGYIFQGGCYDIGDMKSYEMVGQIFGRRLG